MIEAKPFHAISPVAHEWSQLNMTFIYLNGFSIIKLIPVVYVTMGQGHGHILRFHGSNFNN